VNADFPLWYSAYGLLLRSDIPLPITALDTTPTGDPDVVFIRAAPGESAPPPEGVIVASLPCAIHEYDMLVRRGSKGTWIWHQAIATCHIHPGARQVIVYPEAGVEDGLLGLLLAGQVSVFILNQLGIPTLHASAAITEHGAVGFLGPKGRGKSTMAAAFLQRGSTVLTDDVLPLLMDGDGALASPSLPIMKLWQQTVTGTLQLEEELPNLLSNYEKKLLQLGARFAFATTTARLRAFYLLERYDPVAYDRTTIDSRRLNGREGLAALLSQISPGAFLQTAEQARFLPLYARLVAHAPVYRLRYPDGFAYQAAVYDHIMAELATLTGDRQRDVEHPQSLQPQLVS
jgi:hypothetical protein